MFSVFFVLPKNNMLLVEFIPLFWILLAGLTPLVVLIIGVINLVNKVKIGEIFIKLAATFVLYVPVTFFCSLYISSLLNAIGDTKGVMINGIEVNTTVDLTSCGLVLGYSIFGIFLCWFVNYDLSRSLSFITGSEQNFITVFNKK